MKARLYLVSLLLAVVSLLSQLGPERVAPTRAANPQLAPLTGDSVRSTIDLAAAGESAASPQAQNVELVGQIGGPISAVAVQESYAYIGVGPRLVVVNVSDPANPVVTGQTAPFADLVQGVAMAGGYAYVAAGLSGLHVINIANPAAPTVEGHFDTAGKSRRVAVAGSYAYVADFSIDSPSPTGENALRVFDVSNPGGADPNHVAQHAGQSL